MLVKHKKLVKKGQTGFIIDTVEKGASNIIGGGINVIEGLNMPTTNQSTFTGVNDYSQARDAKFDRNMKIGKGLLQAGLGSTGSPLAPLAGMVLDLFSSKGDCKYSLNGRCVSKEELQRAKKSDWQKDNQLAVNRANANLQYIPTNTQLAMKAKKGARLYKKSVEKKQDGGKMDTNFLLKPGTEIDTSSITNKLNPIVFAQLHKAMKGNKNQFAKLQK
jgi:hypothetical protein